MIPPSNIWRGKLLAFMTRMHVAILEVNVCWAFADCNNLASVALPESLERIEPTAFDRCNRIERIIIPQGSTEHFMRFDALKQYRHRFLGKKRTN